MAFEYLFARLPRLPREPGQDAPISLARLAALCSEEGGAAGAIARALFLGSEIRSLARMERGLAPSEPVLFAREELAARRHLPEWLLAELGRPGGAGEDRFDRIWAGFFRELGLAADACGARALARWAAWDAGLRNAVAAHRAIALGREHRPIDVGREPEAEDRAEHRRVVDELITIQERGLDGWRERDRAVARCRLAKARALAPEFTFDLEELAGYLVQAAVLAEFAYLGSGGVA